jgi:hypothetical protein
MSGISAVRCVRCSARPGPCVRAERPKDPSRCPARASSQSPSPRRARRLRRSVWGRAAPAVLVTVPDCLVVPASTHEQDSGDDKDQGRDPTPMFGRHQAPWPQNRCPANGACRLRFVDVHPSSITRTSVSLQNRQAMGSMCRESESRQRAVYTTPFRGAYQRLEGNVAGGVALADRRSRDTELTRGARASPDRCATRARQAGTPRPLPRRIAGPRPTRASTDRAHRHRRAATPADG